jgi:hypothetical protein
VFAEFYDAFYALEGSVEFSAGKVRAQGGSVPENLNQLADAAINGGFSHLFIVEDDSTFPADTVVRLLKHDKPVVAGLCRARTYPFRPYVYRAMDDQGMLIWQELTSQDRGLIRCAATGMGGILIRTEVFAQIPRPYFADYFLGERHWGQDIHFGQALIRAGVEVFCDLDLIIQHGTDCFIGSQFIDGQWQVEVKIGGVTIHVPVTQ